MSQTPPPYVGITGIYTTDDKHQSISKTDYDGSARPGQIVIDTTDYSMWVGNSQGSLNAVGGGSVSTGNITFTGSTISNDNLSPLLVTAAHTTPISVNSDQYAQLYWAPDANDTANFNPDSSVPVYSWAFVSSSGVEFANFNQNLGQSPSWTFEFNGVCRQAIISVDELPDPNTYSGARAVVRDANLAGVGNFGQIVGNLGSNITPVYSDSYNWLIG